jgi:hypothetical protein
MLMVSWPFGMRRVCSLAGPEVILGVGRGVVYIDCYPICKVEVVVDIGCYCYESMFSILYCG